MVRIMVIFLVVVVVLAMFGVFRVQRGTTCPRCGQRPCICRKGGR